MSGDGLADLKRDAEDIARAVADVRKQIGELHGTYHDRLPYWVLLGPGTVDYPGFYLARLWFTLPEPLMTSALVRAGSLRRLRSLQPDVAEFVSRLPEDEPNVIGIWI